MKIVLVKEGNGYRAESPAAMAMLPDRFTVELNEKGEGKIAEIWTDIFPATAAELMEQYKKKKKQKVANGPENS